MMPQITCAGCGKQYEFNIDDTTFDEKHMLIAKCACGATTQVESALKTERDKNMFGQINDILAMVPGIIRQIRESKMEGMDTGVGEAIAEVSKELAMEVLERDEELRDALREHVTEDLRRYLLGPTEGEAENG